MRRLFTKESADRFAFGATLVVGGGTATHYLLRDREFVVSQDSDFEQRVSSLLPWCSVAERLSGLKIMVGEKLLAGKTGEGSGSSTDGRIMPAPSSEEKKSPQPTKFRFSPECSALNFKCSHWGMTVDGTFKNFSGHVQTKGDTGITFVTPRSESSSSAVAGTDESSEGSFTRNKNAEDEEQDSVDHPGYFELQQVSVSVNADSIDTQSWLRDRRMRNEFFEVEKFPLMTFSTNKTTLLSVASHVPTADEQWEKAKNADKNPRLLNEHRVPGTVCIRGIEKPVVLDVVVTKLDKEEVQALVTGEFNRFDFDILSNWPTLAVGRTVFVSFSLVGKRE
ncbi:unnamed protein product [Amoebophrya sp. A120]|nr:unnamed protein product [Amoebophrya sp. A120]|eukprot:GSA120T00017721001.1